MSVAVIFCDKSHKYSLDTAKVMFQRVFCEITGIAIDTHLKFWYLFRIFINGWSFDCGSSALSALAKVFKLLKAKNILDDQVEELPVNHSTMFMFRSQSIIQCRNVSILFFPVQFCECNAPTQIHRLCWYVVTQSVKKQCLSSAKITSIISSLILENSNALTAQTNHISISAH